MKGPLQDRETDVQWLRWIPTVNIWGKNSGSWHGEGKQDPSAIRGASAFLNKTCSQGKLVNQSLADSGEGQSPTAAHSGHLFLLRVGEGGAETERLL